MKNKSSKIKLLIVIQFVFALGAMQVYGVPVNPEFSPPWGWPNGQANGYWDVPHYGTEWDNNPWNLPGKTISTKWNQYGLLGGSKNYGGSDCYGWENLAQTADHTAYMDLYIANQAMPDWTKTLWVQFDYYTQGNLAWTVTVEGDSDLNWDTDDIIERPAGMIGEDKDLGNGWKRRWMSWTLKPQPEQERVKWEIILAAGSKYGIKNVFYSTKCVPEPASICLLGMGCLALFKKRRI